MRPRVVVDRVLCEGNGVCARVAPAVFAVGDDEQVRVLVDEIDDDAREAVETAVRRCPRAALSIDRGK